MIEVFLDVETKTVFSAENARDPARLGVSFVGVFRREGQQGRFLSFFEPDLAGLWPVIEAADLVVGYNIKRFDWPVLNPYYPGDLADSPTLDLMEVVKDALGRRLRLDNVAQATLGEGKLGSGLDAIRYYREGRLEELKKYCLKDVEVTRKVYDFGREHGFLKYIEPPNEIRQFPVTWPVVQKKPATNLTLGI